MIKVLDIDYVHPWILAMKIVDSFANLYIFLTDFRYEELLRNLKNGDKIVPHVFTSRQSYWKILFVALLQNIQFLIQFQLIWNRLKKLRFFVRIVRPDLRLWMLNEICRNLRIINHLLFYSFFN